MHPFVVKENCFQELDIQRQTLIIIDEHVRELYKEALPVGCPILTVPQGERAKNWATIDSLAGQAERLGMTRSAQVVGIGGGATCDVAAFFSATYMRGVDLTLVPTTLLAMCDAAIGGKNGINGTQAKNLIGTFRLPCQVICDTAFLKSLEPNQLADGMAEIIKIAAMCDDHLFDTIDLSPSETVIRRAIELKLKVCQQDPHDQGVRHLLNFGHTFAHAMEIATSYNLSHGQAVGIGMGCAARTSLALGLCEEEVVSKLEHRIVQAGLTLELPDVSIDQMVELMGKDKKNLGEGLTLTLISQIGSGQVVREIDPALVKKVLYMHPSALSLSC